MGMSVNVITQGFMGKLLVMISSVWEIVQAIRVSKIASSNSSKMLNLETGVDNCFDAWHLCCMEGKNIVLSRSFCHDYRSVTTA